MTTSARSSFRDSVVERARHVSGKLLGAMGGDESSDSDEASVALAELGAFPDVAVQDVLSELRELRNCGGLSANLICHMNPPVSAGAAGQRLPGQG